MAKRKNSERAIEIGLDQDDKRVLWRTILITSVLLGGVLVVLYLLLGRVFAEQAGWLNASRTALSLLAFWIFTTSAVRAYHRLREGVSALWLIVVGVAVATFGILLFLLGLRLWNILGGHDAALPGYSIIGFYAGGGLIAALISLINLRVEGERTGKVLELLVIALAVALFFWIAK
ncbi:MAG: hypothetical protein D6772_13410 [Bacteroidetes bacterium]|nr:MAG: hypothetical protein D6772_13410 [Bacteroidota bacterium]